MGRDRCSKNVGGGDKMEVVIDMLSLLVGVGVGLLIWLVWDWYKLRKAKIKVKKGTE
jgi:hypothetical protein